MPQLRARALTVGRQVVLEAEIIEVGMTVRQHGQRADRIDSPERDVGVRVVVEDARTVADRLRPEPVYLPIPALQKHPRRVERAPKVRTLTHVDQPRRAVGHLLTAGPKG